MKNQSFTSSQPELFSLSLPHPLSFVVSLLLMTVCCFTSLNLSAQFTPAGIAETPAGVAYSSRFAGNDVLDFNSNTYEVCTYQDGSTNAGLTWNVGSGTNLGSTSFTRTSDIYVSDVSLLTDNGAGVYAVVTYYEGNGTNTYICEYFQWVGSVATGAFVSIAGPTAIINNTFGNSLHIDATDREYTIVWDGGGQIYAISGDMLGYIIVEHLYPFLISIVQNTLM